MFLLLVNFTKKFWSYFFKPKLSPLHGVIIFNFTPILRPSKVKTLKFNQGFLYIRQKI